MITWEILRETLLGANALKATAKIDPKMTFKEQDFDSLDVASIFLAVEEKFGVKVFSAPEGRPRSFSELLALIEKQHSAK